MNKLNKLIKFFVFYQLESQFKDFNGKILIMKLIQMLNFYFIFNL